MDAVDAIVLFLNELNQRLPSAKKSNQSEYHRVVSDVLKGLSADNSDLDRSARMLQAISVYRAMKASTAPPRRRRSCEIDECNFIFACD